MSRLKEWSRRVKQDVRALYGASRDPRVPWYARTLGLAVTAYALSPIDLIPDFIPVLGLLDDAILVPLGLALFIKMIPADVIAEHRALAAASQGRPSSRAAACVVVCLWLTSISISAWWAYRHFAPHRWL